MGNAEPRVVPAARAAGEVDPAGGLAAPAAEVLVAVWEEVRAVAVVAPGHSFAPST